MYGMSPFICFFRILMKVIAGEPITIPNQVLEPNRRADGTGAVVLVSGDILNIVIIEIQRSPGMDGRGEF